MEGIREITCGGEMGNHVWRGYGKSRVEGVREITCGGDTGNHLWRGYGKSLVEGIREITCGPTFVFDLKTTFT